jgi:chorismate synthase
LALYSGSQHNDKFIPLLEKDKSNKLSILGLNLQNETNYSGGTLGGITTGEDVYFRVAIKPVSTISKEQVTYDYEHNEVKLEAKGRHDPCVLPRAVPIVEGMAALVTIDHCLMQGARKSIIIDDFI